MDIALNRRTGYSDETVFFGFAAAGRQYGDLGTTGDAPYDLGGPDEREGGDVIAVTGENLQKDAVAKVFLTDGKNDIPVEVTEQTATTIKFKVPEKAQAGTRLTVMVLTTGKDAKYIEQPVKLEIDENK